MPKIDITKTELVCPGKYSDDGTRKEVPRVNLPFQIIETINESRATSEVQKTKGFGLFDVYEGKEGDTFEAGWKNKLIWGDNLVVMGSLLEKFAGKIDLIYIDPPFATGADFSFIAEIGERGFLTDKEQSMLEEKAYRDTWGKGLEGYLQVMTERLALLRALLSIEGHLLVHIAPGVSGYLRSVLDELFGGDNFRNEIVVHRPITKNLQRQFDGSLHSHKDMTLSCGTRRNRTHEYRIYLCPTRQLSPKAIGTGSGVVRTAQACDTSF